MTTTRDTQRQIAETVRGAFDEGQGLGRKQGFERGVLVALGEAPATEDEARYLRGLHARSDLRPVEPKSGRAGLLMGLAAALVVVTYYAGVMMGAMS